MLKEGFIEEVKNLLVQGYGAELKAMQSLGYRHIAAYLAGEIDLATAVTTMKRDHRRYAKRQMTWFRADPAVHWFRPDEIQTIEEEVSIFLSCHDEKRC